MAVMHAGHLVETAPTAALLGRPRHPYTRGLLAATPLGQTRIEDFTAIPGSIPDLRAALPPCRFRDRCDRRETDCDAGPLVAHTVEPDHLVSCRHPL
jgi:peptide/nickel transport system ATP-binding protein